jgi:hypothetical protein
LTNRHSSTVNRKNPTANPRHYRKTEKPNLKTKFTKNLVLALRQGGNHSSAVQITERPKGGLSGLRAFCAIFMFYFLLGTPGGSLLAHPKEKPKGARVGAICCFFHQGAALGGTGPFQQELSEYG